MRSVVALDLIPQIECSNSYALRLRNPKELVQCLHCTPLPPIHR